MVASSLLRLTLATRCRWSRSGRLDQDPKNQSAESSGKATTWPHTEHQGLGCIKECGQVADYQTGSYLWQHHHVGSSVPNSKRKPCRWSCKTTGPLPKWPKNSRSTTARWAIG